MTTSSVRTRATADALEMTCNSSMIRLFATLGGLLLCVIVLISPATECIPAHGHSSTAVATRTTGHELSHLRAARSALGDGGESDYGGGDGDESDGNESDVNESDVDDVDDVDDGDDDDDDDDDDNSGDHGKDGSNSTTQSRSHS